MEEKTKDKPLKWTIRITLEEPNSDWEATGLMDVVTDWLNSNEGFKGVKCTRIEVENDDY